MICHFISLLQPPTVQEDSSSHPEKRKSTQETPDSAKKRKSKALDVDLPNAPLDGIYKPVYGTIQYNHLRYNTFIRCISKAVKISSKMIINITYINTKINITIYSKAVLFGFNMVLDTRQLIVYKNLFIALFIKTQIWIQYYFRMDKKIEKM